MEKYPCGCDICGKFRKEKDVFIDEEITIDGFSVNQWTKCKYCCSQADYERYFLIEEENEK